MSLPLRDYFGFCAYGMHASCMCQTCAYNSHEFKPKINITSQFKSMLACVADETKPRYSLTGVQFRLQCRLKHVCAFLFTDCWHHSLTITSFLRGDISPFFFFPQIPFYIYIYCHQIQQKLQTVSHSSMSILFRFTFSSTELTCNNPSYSRILIGNKPAYLTLLKPSHKINPMINFACVRHV